MAEDLMRYDLLAQEALRGVVRAALRKVVKSGLPGDHHFYIAFDTRFPGVQLSERLDRKYPSEMTIVIQHQYWNLHVHETGFEVELSFDNIPEKLVIPFDAIKGFLDPHVQFGLQFEVTAAEKLREGNPERTSRELAATDQVAGVPEPASADDGPLGEEPAKIVSLDSFRKK